MWANVYVAEKLRELDQERLAHIKHAELQKLEFAETSGLEPASGASRTVASAGR